MYYKLCFFTCIQCSKLTFIVILFFKFLAFISLFHCLFLLYKLSFTKYYPQYLYIRQISQHIPDYHLCLFLRLFHCICFDHKSLVVDTLISYLHLLFSKGIVYIAKVYLLDILRFIYLLFLIAFCNYIVKPYSIYFYSKRAFLYILNSIVKRNILKYNSWYYYFLYEEVLI